MFQKKLDSTIKEIHQVRREISDRFAGDVLAIAEDSAKRQGPPNRPVWKPQLDVRVNIAESSSLGESTAGDA